MSERQSDEPLARVLFGTGGGSRRLRGAAVVAILVHFALFAIVFPHQERVFDVETRDATVIRRYEPPRPPEPPKPVRKHTTRVPIPDASPEEPEVLLEEMKEIEQPTVPPETEFVVGMPASTPDPAALRDAMEMETEGLLPPRLRRRVRPEYDPQRARRGIQGKVDIQIVVGEGGLVEFARVINSANDEELDKRALAAVQKWEFEPATFAGDAVPVRCMVTINFRIY